MQRRQRRSSFLGGRHDLFRIAAQTEGISGAAAALVTSEELDFLHREMLPVARPKRRFVVDRRGRDQRVADLNVMAALILPEIGSRPGSDYLIDCSALQRLEQTPHQLLFMRQSPGP